MNKSESDGVDRDSGGESGQGALAGRDRKNVSPGSSPASRSTASDGSSFHAFKIVRYWFFLYLSSVSLFQIYTEKITINQ